MSAHAWLGFLSLFLLSIVFSCQSVGTGTHHCTWGPSYWCESLETAEECAALDYCILHVWGNKTTKSEVVDYGKIKPSPGLCLLCNFTLELLKPYIDRNASENEVSHILEKICAALPGPYNYTCQQEIVEFIFPAVWVVLQLEVDYGVACANLHFCNSTNTTTGMTSEVAKELISAHRELSAVKQEHVPTGPLCSFCHEIVTAIKPYVDKNTTEPDLQKTIDAICKHLPSPYNNTCDQSVKEYLPLAFDIIRKQVDAGKACQDMGFCTNSTVLEKQFLSSVDKSPHSLDHATRRESSPSLCKACELVADFMQIYLHNNASEEEVGEAVERLCNELPSNATCLSVTDSYLPLIWKLLQQSVDSQDVCKHLHICPSTVPNVMSVGKPLDMCTTCMDAAEVLKPIAASNATEKAFQEALGVLCKFILPSEPGACRTLDIILSVVWELIHKEIDSKQLCVKLTFCNSTTPSAIKPDIEPTFDPLLCKACELVVEDYKPVIDNNSTLPKIMEIAKSFCPDIPTYAPDCNAFVSEYIPIYYKILLKKSFDEGTVCSGLHICPPK